MKDVMIDLETYSTKQHAVIATLGAVKFDPITGELGDELYLLFSVDSQITCGQVVDDSTLSWWMRQDAAARLELSHDKRLPLMPALMRLKAFLTEKDVRVWGNGAAFDLGILKAAHEAIGFAIPWKHYNERCFRTLKAMFPIEEQDVIARRIAHHALDDAKHQARYVGQISRTYGFTYDYRQLNSYQVTH